METHQLIKLPHVVHNMAISFVLKQQAKKKSNRQNKKQRINSMPCFQYMRNLSTTQGVLNIISKVLLSFILSKVYYNFCFTEVNQIWIQFNKKATINKLWSSSKFALKEPSRSFNYSNAKCHVYLQKPHDLTFKFVCSVRVWPTSAKISKLKTHGEVYVFQTF